MVLVLLLILLMGHFQISLKNECKVQFKVVLFLTMPVLKLQLEVSMDIHIY